MTTVSSPRLTVEPIAGALGATVSGLDLAAVSDPAQLAGLRQALADHLVVFLPDQRLDLDALERVTDLLGGRDVTPFVDPIEDRPYVIRVIKEPTDVLNFANAWHSDLSYLPAPPAYTLLHAWDVPPYGGDTLWSNQYLAYETLSPGLRATLDGLEAVHSAGLAYGPGGLLGPGQGPDVHGHCAVAGRLGRVRPPGRGRPSGDGSAGPLREPGLHRALQGVDQGGVAAAARAPLPAGASTRTSPAACVGRCTC